MATALITGASSGIGLELAKIHASKGDELVLVARRKILLDQIKTELQAQFGIQVTVIEKDLGLPEAAQQIFEHTQQANIKVNYLINNAGIGDFGMFADADIHKQTLMIQLNIVALTQLTKLYLPEMIKNKSGKIMNVASVAAFQPGPLMSVYFATKAYVLSFSQALDNEVRDKGISVTTLCPGPTQSEFFETAAMLSNKAIKGKKFPTSRQVAEYGYKAMIKGQTVAIHGRMYGFLATIVGFLPRSLVVILARKAQS